jgi:hypothetical protein
MSAEDFKITSTKIGHEPSPELARRLAEASAMRRVPEHDTELGWCICGAWHDTDKKDAYKRRFGSKERGLTLYTNPAIHDTTTPDGIHYEADPIEIARKLTETYVKTLGYREPQDMRAFHWQLYSARRQSRADLERHASVSLSNGHRCGDCFTCACVTVLEERGWRKAAS